MRDSDQELLDEVEKRLKALAKVKNLTKEPRRSFTDDEVRAMLGAAKR